MLLDKPLYAETDEVLSQFILDVVLDHLYELRLLLN